MQGLFDGRETNNFSTLHIYFREFPVSLRYRKYNFKKTLQNMKKLNTRSVVMDTSFFHAVLTGGRS